MYVYFHCIILRQLTGNADKLTVIIPTTLV